VGIKAQAKAIQVLINNAGAARMNYLLVLGKGEVEDSFALNAVAPIACLRVFARLMVGGGGHVVNISSIAAAANFAGTVGYAAAKAALDKVTKLAAMELASYMVMVNGVSLPPMEMGLGEHMREEDRQKGLEKTVLGRSIGLDEVLHCIDFLCAPANTYLSGETLHLGGLV
jgi:NAD(P)-dependent dehydrogenase (short-subunit alcohol dehydrogenase family)